MHMQGCTKWIIPSREEQGFLNEESARQQFSMAFSKKVICFPNSAYRRTNELWKIGLEMHTGPCQTRQAPH